MTYLFKDSSSIPGFDKLGAALGEGGRMTVRLPTVDFCTADLAGKVASPSAVAGADVIPWRPALGIYLLIERGWSNPADLLSVDGVAGIWWYHRRSSTSSDVNGADELQLSYLYLDSDPVEVAHLLAAPLADRWKSGAIEGLLAAPFYTIVPFEWDRYLPADGSSPTSSNSETS